MIKVNKVEYGLFPYASAAGMNVFHIDIKCDDKPCEDTSKNVDNASVMAQTIEKAVEKNGWQDAWNLAMLGQCYVVFTGDDIPSDANMPAFNAFYNMMSELSLSVQKNTPAYKLRPIGFGFAGTPKYYTGEDQWYEHFNLIYIKAPLYDGEGNLYTKDTLTSAVNNFALIEMQRHAFGNLVAECNSAEDVDNFNELYLKNGALSISKDRCVCVAVKDTKEVAKACLKQGLRFSMCLPAMKEVVKI